MRRGDNSRILLLTYSMESFMKRFHVHAHVDDLKASVAFYSKLFAAEPTRLESDYAKWMIEDPRITWVRYGAIGSFGRAAGTKTGRER